MDVIMRARLMMPIKAYGKSKALPRVVVGAKSPNPTVNIVTSAQYTASKYAQSSAAEKTSAPTKR